jgi:hypothetical protein
MGILAAQRGAEGTLMGKEDCASWANTSGNHQDGIATKLKGIT